jgi:predicted nucleic acid-binding Zn ribbon protein
MPRYDYQCPVCGEVKEVQHTIAELEQPSEETLLEISCNCIEQQISKMERVYLSAPGIKTPTKNRYLDADRKKRNHKHFIKEVLPTLDNDSKKHHLNKLGKKL